MAPELRRGEIVRIVVENGKLLLTASRRRPGNDAVDNGMASSTEEGRRRWMKDAVDRGRAPSTE